MKVVIDTNVFISGIFWKGEPHKVLEHWKQGKITIITSEETLSELKRVMDDFKIQLPEEMIRGWLNLILRNAILVKPKEKIDAVKDDHKDNMFVEAAISANAEYIISKDKHLLKLYSYKGIKMIKPEEFNKLPI
jgi:putative PIN family toxin of toxin-antitoxin system